MTTRKLLYLMMLSIMISGCVLAPGMQTLDLQRTGEVRDADGQVVPRGIQAINAKLINSLREKSSADSSPSTTTKASSMASLTSNQSSRAQQKAQEYVYRVGPADILTIIVWEHPELTIPAGAERTAEQAGTVVESDGTIYFPYAGVIQVAGKTLPQIREMLTEKLSTFIEDVKLDVRMAQYNHKRVYVVGEVKQPSTQAINNIPPTIVEMINGAGGFSDEADRQTVTFTRDGETHRVDLLALYEKGDISQNVMLQSGDVVNVWDRSSTKIFVMGEVMQPGSYFVDKGRKSLAEALSDAGGVNPNTSDPGQVYVFRQKKDQAAEVFHLNAASPDALLLADQFALSPRDIIYVDAADVVRWARVIQNISGTASTLNQASQTDFPLFKGDL